MNTPPARRKMRLSWYLGLTIAGLLLPSGGAYSAYLRNLPVTVVQPGGDTLHCFASGDEYYNWLHDENGFTIMRSSQTGFYEYATLSGGRVVCTGAVAGRVNPFTLGIQRNAIAPPEIREGLRSRGLARVSATVNSPNTGIFNNLVIFVRFSDQSEFSDPFPTYAELFNGNSPTSTSLAAYFKEASYNRLTINSSFYPAPAGGQIVSYQDIHPRNYYMPYDAILNPTGYASAGKSGREDSLFLRAIAAVKNQIPDTLNIDANGDGYVDNLCFIVKGEMGAWGNLLWPHKGYCPGGTIHGKATWYFNLNVEGFITLEGSSVVCHEMFHTLGAPDLYHYSNLDYEPVGLWDVMAYNASPPQHMSAFLKFRYGHWISSVPLISSPGSYTLRPLTDSSDNCFRIPSLRSATEYYVVEYRKKNGLFESSLPGEGLLVYRINTSSDGIGDAAGPPDEVYIYRKGGTATINGDFLLAPMSADVGRTSLNDFSDPSGFFSTGSPGGLSISSVGTAGNTISFSVDGPLPIVLSSFAAQPSAGGEVTLRWTTTSETNNYGFFVERKGGNDSAFTPLAGSFIAGHGTTLESEEYQYTDLHSPRAIVAYRLKQINLDGSFRYSESVSVDLSRTPDAPQVPAVFSLHQNYPNPFNPSTVIEFSVARQGHAIVTIYNALGESVATLFDGVALPGSLYRTKFDGTDLASGVYFCRLASGGSASTKRLLLIK